MNGFVHRNIVFSYYYILCTVYDYLNKISSQLTLKAFFSGKQRQQSTGSRVDVRPASCFHCKHRVLHRHTRYFYGANKNTNKDAQHPNSQSNDFLVLL